MVGEPSGAIRVFGWRFAPLAFLVLLTGGAVCWKLVDSNAVFHAVSLGNGKPGRALAVRRTPAAKVTPVAPAVEEKTSRAQTTPAPPAPASVRSEIEQPVVLPVRTEDGVRDDLPAVDTVSAEKPKAESASRVDELLAAANRIVGGALPDAASRVDPTVLPLAADVDVPQAISRATPATRPEIEVIPQGEILRPPEYGKIKVRKTNHESVVASWNTMPREMVDAIDGGSVEKVRELVARGVDINASDIRGETALIKAAWNSDVTMVGVLLDLGADVFLASNDGRTALYTGVVSGNVEVVGQLLQGGAPTNVTTDFGKTPLMASAWSDYPEITLMLLRYGAEPNQLDTSGRSAVFYALWDRNEYVARILAANGANLHITDYLGQSAADIARLRRIDISRDPGDGSRLN
jgi:hypothetical protein